MEQTFVKEQEKINVIVNPQDKQKAQNNLDAKKAIINSVALPKVALRNPPTRGPE